MGVCDSSNNNIKNENPKPKPKVLNAYAVENDTTGIFKKYNITDSNISAIKKKYNGYLLPSALAKRDNVSKYYNINEKVIGEGAYGQVCIGEKNKKTYAIKK